MMALEHTGSALGDSADGFPSEVNCPVVVALHLRHASCMVSCASGSTLLSTGICSPCMPQRVQARCAQDYSHGHS
eukprot:6464030-Amphidinium_carterae.2